MRFGSLFSGIGGLDLGLERAGMEPAWQVEVDPYCRAVLKKHWPDVPRYGDVRLIVEGALDDVELVCGGFPCQPVSYAGARRAQADERWLWPAFERVLRLVRPRYVIVENVPGLLTAGMGDVLGGLAGLGFDAEWDLLPAAAVGAPHLRYRVCIVAHRAGSPRPDADGAGLDRTEVHQLGAAELRDEQEREPGPVGADVPHANGRGRTAGAERHGEPLRAIVPPRWYDPRRPARWVPEPGVGRVVDGVPSGLDRARLSALGNSVVPQWAEQVGRWVMTHHQSQDSEDAS